MTALRVEEAAADRQPEAGPGATPILRLDAVEFVEDPLEIGGWNARSFIENLDHHDLTVAASTYIDAAARRRVFGSVVGWTR